MSVAQSGASAVERLIEGLVEQPDADERLRTTAAGLLSVVREHRLESGDGFFLSVVMRTQGKRIEALQDGLLTLYGQSDQDFEVLIMTHDIEAGARDELLAVLDAQPEEFRGRIRMIDVFGGGRARPLNASVSQIAGRYVAFFDDDDLLLGNWVETFRAGAAESPGRLVRAICASQRTASEEWSGGRRGYRSVAWPDPEYPSEFDPVAHIRANQSPFMSIAFPRELFSLWGLRFDETLPVCEDWDMLLRGAFLLGVHSIGELTSVYRRWTGVASSYSEHEKLEWQTAHDEVRRRFEQQPRVLPEGFERALADALDAEREGMEAHVSSLLATNRELATQIDAIRSSASWRLTAGLRALTGAARKALRR